MQSDGARLKTGTEKKKDDGWADEKRKRQREAVALLKSKRERTGTIRGVG